MNFTETEKWDNYAKNLGKTSFPMEIMEKYCEKGVVLDLGCGKGYHADHVRKFAAEVYAIDPSKLCIKEAKKQFPGIRFMVGSAYELPFNQETFDCVYAIDVIEHLDEPEKMLGEARRVLKEGGHLILQTPNYPIKRLYDLLNYMRPSVKWRRDWRDDPTHVSKFSFSSLEKSIGKFFTIKDIFSRNILLENRVAFLKASKRNKFGLLMGQKTIVVAKK